MAINYGNSSCSRAKTVDCTERMNFDVSFSVQPAWLDQDEILTPLSYSLTGLDQGRVEEDVSIFVCGLAPKPASRINLIGARLQLTSGYGDQPCI